MFIFERVPQTLTSIDRVVISASFLSNLEHLVFDQFCKNALNGPLSDPNFLRKVTDSRIGLSRKTYDEVEVIRQKGPTWGAGIRLLGSHR